MNRYKVKRRVNRPPRLIENEIVMSVSQTITMQRFMFPIRPCLFYLPLLNPIEIILNLWIALQILKECSSPSLCYLHSQKFKNVYIIIISLAR